MLNYKLLFFEIIYIDMTDKPTKKTEAIVLTKDEKEKIIKKDI